MRSDVQLLEADLAEAIRGRDAAAAAPLLAEEFVLTSSLGTGLQVDRRAWLENLAAIETEELVVRDVQVREFAEVAVAVWRMDWRARAGADDLSGPYLVTDVWRQGRLSWRTWARLNAGFLQEERP